jgi:hypothetical protein
MSAPMASVSWRTEVKDRLLVSLVLLPRAKVRVSGRRVEDQCHLA